MDMSKLQHAAVERTCQNIEHKHKNMAIEYTLSGHVNYFDIHIQFS